MYAAVRRLEQLRWRYWGGELLLALSADIGTEN